VVVFGFGFALLGEALSFSSPKEYQKRRSSFRQFRIKELPPRLYHALVRISAIIFPDMKDKDDRVIDF